MQTQGLVAPHQSVCPLYPQPPALRPLSVRGRRVVSAPLCPAVPVASQDCPQGCALFGQGPRGSAATAEIAPGTQVKAGSACPHLSPERVGAHTAWGKRKGGDALLGAQPSRLPPTVCRCPSSYRTPLPSRHFRFSIRTICVTPVLIRRHALCDCHPARTWSRPVRADGPNQLLLV